MKLFTGFEIKITIPSCIQGVGENSAEGYVTIKNNKMEILGYMTIWDIYEDKPPRPYHALTLKVIDNKAVIQQFLSYLSADEYGISKAMGAIDHYIKTGEIYSEEKQKALFDALWQGE